MMNIIEKKHSFFELIQVNKNFKVAHEKYFEINKENTSIAYRIDIEHFLQNVENIDYINAENYFKMIVKDGYNKFSKSQKYLGTFMYTKASLIRKKASISSYIEIMHEYGLISFNFIKSKSFQLFFKTLLSSVEKEKGDGQKPSPTHINQLKIKSILNKFNIDDITQLRNKIIFALGYYAGLRRSEMCNLKFTDIKNNVLIIRNAKGGTGEVMIHSELNELLLFCKEKYLEEKILTKKNKGFEYVIVSLHRGKYGEKLSPQALNMIVKQICLENGIKEIITAHSLRHSTAISMIKQGTDISYVARHLRHKSLDTTKDYLSSISTTENPGVIKL